MTQTRVTVVVICALALVGACRGDDDPVIDGSNASTSSSAPAAATPCEAVRQDLERLRETLGAPDGIEQLKQMLADGLDQVEAAVRDAGGLAGEAAAPVKDSVQQAVGNIRSAVAAVADGNFGTAREELGQANGDVGRAWDQLGEVCESAPLESLRPR